MSIRNQVFPLSITTLSPVHIGTGARLMANSDYAVDGQTTYVIDSDVALDLVLQRWEAGQLSPEEQRRQRAAALAAEEQRLKERRERNRREIITFEESPPKDRSKRQQLEDRLVKEATRIKADLADLKKRQAQLDAPGTFVPVVLPDDLLKSSGVTDLLATKWLTLADLHTRTVLDGRLLVRYAYSGHPSTESSEIYELIKDVSDRPYLPGSSLKGAIRSALAWDYARDLTPTLFDDLTRRGAKGADNRIEESLFSGKDGSGQRRVGNGVVRDVLRTLHIGDSAPAAVEPTLLTVAIFRSSSQRSARLAVEAIPAQTTLRATLQVERYAFESREAKQVLDFGPWQQRLTPEALAASCRRRAAALITEEQHYFAERSSPAPALERRYSELAAQLESLDARSFLLPVGWGTGWRSKTLDDRLRSDAEREQEFVEVVQRFSMKKHKSARFAANDLFPQTRKVVMANDQPAQPLGWVQVTIGEEGQR